MTEGRGNHEGTGRVRKRNGGIGTVNTGARDAATGQEIMAGGGAGTMKMMVRMGSDVIATEGTTVVDMEIGIEIGDGTIGTALENEGTGDEGMTTIDRRVGDREAGHHDATMTSNFKTPQDTKLHLTFPSPPSPPPRSSVGYTSLELRYRKRHTYLSHKKSVIVSCHIGILGCLSSPSLFAVFSFRDTASSRLGRSIASRPRPRGGRTSPTARRGRRR